MAYTRGNAQFATEINAPAGDVWALLSDWGGLLRWWPANGPAAILSVELRGDPTHLPLDRVLTMSDQSKITESLLKTDPDARRIYYAVSDGFLNNIRNYMATNIMDEMADKKCLLTFSSLFDAPSAEEALQLEKIIVSMYTAAGLGLSGYFAIK